MTIFLIILLALLLLITIGVAYELYRKDNTDKNQFENKIHELESSHASVLDQLFKRTDKGELEKRELGKKVFELETTLASVKTELDKNVQAIATQRTQSQYEIYSAKIVSQMNQGVICIDENRSIQLANVYAEQFLKTSSARGKPYQEVLGILVNGVRDYSFFEQAFSGKSQVLSGTVEIESMRGKTPIAGTITPLADDGIVKTIVFIFTDSSQHILRVEEEKAFFSAAAHELRTPLTVIRMNVLVMLQQLDKLDREKMITYLTRTKESVEYLVNLVNDFLNLSRIDQGRLVVDNKSFNIVTLTEEVIKDLLPLAQERKLYLNHAPVEGEYRNVVGDPTKSKEVLTNLISNAIKYTIQGGITVSHLATDTTLTTKVTDTGNGISLEEKKLLFKRFFQVGQARQQSSKKGTGLGLYISKKIANLMHGEVALESSEPGNGSTFVFILPLVPK